MGGSQSTPTRKISISNEESHLIKISEAVAERLRKCAEGSPEALKSQEGCEPGEYEKDVRDTQPDPKFSGDALINYYYGPSITSIRILQEKEKELKDSEDYWTKRIQKMENHHARLSQIMENEFHKAIVEISCQNPRPPPNSPFPCNETKDKVLDCLKKNPKEVLLCAGEVNEFSNCVHGKRIYPEKLKGCE